MGQIAARIYSSAVREIKMFNIEKRAENVISKDKPTPAPLHPSSLKELERLKAENVSMDYIYKKDEVLDEHLKKVYVTSPDSSPPLKRIENPLRPLPQSRQRQAGLSYGYSLEEEESKAEGKVSLRQALQFIVAHATDPKTHDSSAISKEHKLDLAVTADILEHFKMFNITVKKKGVDPDTLSEGAKLQMRLQAMNFVNAWELAQELNVKKRTFGFGSKEKPNADEKLDRPTKSDSGSS